MPPQPRASKRTTGRARKGSRWLRQTRREAAHAVAGSKKTPSAAVPATHVAVVAKKAEVALAHTILVTTYHVLTRREPYRDLDPNDVEHEGPVVRPEERTWTITVPQRFTHHENVLTRTWTVFDRFHGYAIRTHLTQAAAVHWARGYEATGRRQCAEWHEAEHRDGPL